MIAIDERGRIVVEPGHVPLVAIEKVLISETLRVHGGNKKNAARALMISRSAFYAKLKRLGLWSSPCTTCGGEGHTAEHHDTQLPAVASAPDPLPPLPPTGVGTREPPGAAA